MPGVWAWAEAGAGRERSWGAGEEGPVAKETARSWGRAGLGKDGARGTGGRAGPKTKRLRAGCRVRTHHAHTGTMLHFPFQL